MQGSNVSPQQALKAARSGLLTALTAAAKAVQSDDASPGLVAQALQGVVSSQQAYNAAVVRIPLSVMTDGALFNDMAAGPGPGSPPSVPDATTPVELIAEVANLGGTINARKWADTFLAVNKNRAIDREGLVGWFANAIQSGMGARAALEQGATAPPRYP